MKTFVAFLIALSCMRSAFAEISLGGAVDDERVSLVYEPSSGRLSVEAGGKKLMTIIEVVSKSQLFGNASNSRVLDGKLDKCQEQAL